MDQVYFKRPHLTDRLTQALTKPLTLVTAGAGYGKTQAVYEFLQAYNAVTIWMQLSRFDNLPTRLWENFIYAVSLQNKRLAADLIAMGFPVSMQEYDYFLTILSNETKTGTPYVLVYDDFHLIHEPHVLDFFERFIEARLPYVSIIIISRKEPAVNTIGLQAKGLVSVLDEDDLRFSREEIALYFQSQVVHLSSKAIADVFAYTEGWIFAIILVGMSLKKGAFNESFAISAAKRNVFRLIESEVFAALPDEVQDFFIRLSLIDHLPAELLTEIAFYDDTLVTQLTELNSFIRYDAFLRTYRIHPLFLEFLVERQNRLNVEDIKKIYQKSADWYVANGYSIDALTYYEKAGQYESMLNIIVTYYACCPIETAKFILGVLERLPERLYAERSFLRVVRAKFVLNCYLFERAYEEFTAIVTDYASRPLTDETRSMLGESYIALGFIGMVRCSYTADYSFERYYRLADTYLPNGSTLINKKNFLFNTGTFSCCVGRSEAGEFDRFVDAMCKTMPYASKVTNGSGYGSEYLCMAEKAYYQGDMKQTITCASHAIAEARQQNQYTTECLALFLLVKANASYGHFSEIVSLLAQLHAVCKNFNVPNSYKILDITEGWYYAQIKQPDKVAEWIRRDMGSLNKETTTIDYIFGRIIRAKCYLAEQKYHELLAFLDKHEEVYGPNLYVLGALEKRVIKAVALYQVKKTDQAMALLQEAYQLAAPDSLFMPFIEVGMKMRSLMKTAQKSQQLGIPVQWLETMATKANSYAKRIANITTEYRLTNHLESDMRANLTRKELDMLTDLCHGFSREEIADDLNLSVNTVKGMLQVVFDKLGAENTIDAVRIAISLNLVK